MDIQPDSAPHVNVKSMICFNCAEASMLCNAAVGSGMEAGGSDNALTDSQSHMNGAAGSQHHDDGALDLCSSPDMSPVSKVVTRPLW